MAATDNSPYQALRLKHLQGIPPNCDPQRATETFSAYVQRMYANGVWPDIGATESDADYLTRIYQLAEAYLFTGLNETVKSSINSITASYALKAQTEIDPEATASYAITASYTIASGTNFTTADTASNVVATTTAGTSVDARATTSGYGVYAESVLSEAVRAAQGGLPTGNVNRGVISATRDFLGLNGYDTTAAIVTITNAKNTGSAGFLTCHAAATEVFKVDNTGSLYSSGSKGFTGVVAFHDGDTNEVSMSFRGGLFVGLL